MKKSHCGSSQASYLNKRQSTDSCLLLKNVEETMALGQAIHHNFPDVNLLLIEGPLGVGKTSLVKGLAISLGINEPITSPTFALAQHYPSGQPPLIHLDLYRLEEHKAADELFLQEEEESKSQDGLMVVEWPERLSLALPEAWNLQLNYCDDGGRTAQIHPPQNPARNSFTWL